MHLKLQILRLQAWFLDFNPEFQKSTNAQLWVRFNMGWIFWHQQILSDLVRCVGVSLLIDDNSLAGEFGHSVRVIVDVDLASHLSNSTLLNRKGGSITVNLFYENILDYCNACNTIIRQTSGEKGEVQFSSKGCEDF